MCAHQPRTSRPSTAAGPHRALVGISAALGAGLLLAGCTGASAEDLPSATDGAAAATVAPVVSPAEPTVGPTVEPSLPPEGPSGTTAPSEVPTTTAPTDVPTTDPTSSPTGLPTGSPTAPSPLPSAAACPGLGEGEDPRDVVDVRTVDPVGSLQVTVALRDGLDLPDVCAYPFGLSSWVWVAPVEGGAPVPVLLAHDEGVLTGSASLVLEVTTSCPGTAVLRTGTEVGEVPLPVGDPRVLVAVATDDGCPPAGGATDPAPAAPAAGGGEPVAAGATGRDEPAAARPLDRAVLAADRRPRAVPVDDLLDDVSGDRSDDLSDDVPDDVPDRPARSAPAVPGPVVPGAAPVAGSGTATGSAPSAAPAARTTGTADGARSAPEASPGVTTEGALPPEDDSGAAAAPGGGGTTAARWAAAAAGVLALAALGSTVALARARGGGRHAAA